jgi:aspartate/methionine/tyrosine aminotransferase
MNYSQRARESEPSATVAVGNLAAELREDALSEARIATVPGSAFNAPGYARFAYTCDTERLKEAVDRLSKGDFFEPSPTPGAKLR